MPRSSTAPLTGADRQAVLAIARTLQGGALFNEAAFLPLLDHMRAGDHDTGSQPIRAGDPEALECFVLSGIVRSWVGDADGRTVTLDFFTGPGVLAPSIARTANGRSRVHCEVLRPARLVFFDAQVLVRRMVESPPVQRWGDAVLRAELVRRADREWSLAALSARERLLELRRRRPGLEDQVSHRHIASYLGISPVSLSRLRGQCEQS